MAGPSDSPLLQYLLVIRRQKWTIILLTLIGAGVAFGISRLQSPVYQSQSEILLSADQSQSALAGISSTTPNIPDEIQRLESAPVAEAVRQKIGAVPSVSASQLSATTDVIVVSVSASSPSAAAKGANAYAEAYLSVRQAQQQAAVQSTLAVLQSQLTAVQNQIPPGATIGTGASPTVTALVQQEASIAQRIETLQLVSALNTGGAQIIQPGSLPTTPVSPKPVHDGILGLGCGLVLGLALAFVREQLDETISGKEDLSEALGTLPVLGVIPALSGGRKAKAPTGVISATHPQAVASEAHRQVRTALQFLTLERPAQLVQVTSPRTAEGKTTVAANLAVAFAQAGQRVIAVDCDLRRPRLHELFSVPSEVGFTTVVLGQLALSEALQPVAGVDSLRVLACGQRPPNPSELLGSQRAAQIFDSLRAEADVVIVDSPPLLPVTDAVVISTRMDATVLVAMAGSTTRRDVGRALEVLGQVGAPLVGTVLNRVAADADYGYRYGYAYAYGPPSEAPARRS